jgi:membrane-bound inhibitor of C-type lysozyme
MFALVALPAFAASPGPIEAHYECSTGTRLSATFSSPTVSPGSVILVFAGARRLIILPQVVSADGGRYANSDMEFWIKGKEARLTREGKRETCHAD